MLSSKKIYLQRDFTAGVYLSGGGGGYEPERRLEKHSSQSWVKNTNMTYCVSNLGTLINTCRKVSQNKFKYLNENLHTFLFFDALKTWRISSKMYKNRMKKN